MLLPLRPPHLHRGVRHAPPPALQWLHHALPTLVLQGPRRLLRTAAPERLRLAGGDRQAEAGVDGAVGAVADEMSQAQDDLTGTGEEELDAFAELSGARRITPPPHESVQVFQAPTQGFGLQSRGCFVHSVAPALFSVQ